MHALRSGAGAGRLRLGVALALLVLCAPQASACGWLWACGDRPYAYRSGPPVYGYRAVPRGYGYRAWGWPYGYANPARAYGYAYAPWPSTSMPPSRWYAATALPGLNSNAEGLRMPVATQQGLLEGGLPGRGPSLFGPNPPPAVSGWGYYYAGHYYKAPTYGYYSPRSYQPPADTPSWWLEPRRRR